MTEKELYEIEAKVNENIVVTKDENGVERFFFNANGNLTPIGSREMFEEWKRLLVSYIPRFEELFLSFNEELEKAIEKHNK